MVRLWPRRKRVTTPAANFRDRMAAAVARTLLAWAAGRVHPAHREWIEAMRAELDEIEPGGAQLRWALGGVPLVWRDTLVRIRRLAFPVLALMLLLVAPFQRVHVLVPLAACAALILRRVRVPPLASGPPPRALQAVVLAGVGACIALAVYGVTRYPIGGPSASLSTALFAATLAGYVGIAFAWPSSLVTAGSGLRYGTLGGIGTGCLLLLGSVPLVPIDSGWITPVGSLVAPVAIGMWAAAASGRSRTALEAGLWSGLIGALIFFVGLMSLTYADTGWFTHDPGTVADFQNSWSPRHFHEYRNHYHSITIFLIGHNLGQASVWLGLAPVLSTIFGALGGVLGVSQRPEITGKGYQ